MRFLLAGVSLICLPITNAQVKLTKGEGRVAIEIDGQPFGDFIFDGSGAKPYFAPLRSPSGKIVTRRYPMEKVEGEPRDHNHQRGLWFAHGDVNGIDFWGADPLNKPGPKLGKVVTKSIGELKNGDKSGSLEGVFDWTDPGGKTLLTESRAMTFYSDPLLRIVDVDITLRAREKVIFGDTKEGTFGIRIAPAIQESGHSGRMINAEGAETEKNVWGKPSPWVDYFGVLDGEKLGIAIFDHPENRRHPVRWHVRGYGLFAANPFGLAEFTGDKSQNGAITLEPGQTLRYRYRVVIHPGDAKTAGIGEMYRKWIN